MVVVVETVGFHCQLVELETPDCGVVEDDHAHDCVDVV